MKTITMMLCVNHHRNGMYAGRCAGIDVGRTLELRPCILPEPRCTMKPLWFSLHHCAVNILSHQNWVSNWCWDAITVTVDDAARLIHRCLTHKSNRHHVWSIDMASGDEAIALADAVRGTPASVTVEMVRKTLEAVA
jgi:hypothetical protein